MFRKRNIIPTLILVCCCMGLSGQDKDLLSTYIPLPPQELSVKQYLYHIQEVTGGNLTYSNRIVEDRRLAIMADSIMVHQLLDTLFAEQEIRYIKRWNGLILSPQNEVIPAVPQISLSGKVMNMKNHRPVSFATISIPNTSIGTVSNTEGAFEIVFPDTCNYDTLIVSCIGYELTKVAWPDYSEKDFIVKLAPSRFSIEELVVRPEDPLYLIQAALSNKRNNYATKPEMLRAFFRESSKQDDKHISLSEAVIDIYKTSYISDNQDLVKLDKGRTGKDTQATGLINLVIEGGLYNNMLLDVMKYTPNFLNPEFFDAYQYSLRKLTSYKERLTYIIDFTFTEKKSFLGYNGRLFIDANTLALVRAEFKIPAHALRYARKEFVRKSPIGIRVKARYGRYFVEYRMYNQKWRLNHARSEVGFRVKRRLRKQNARFSCFFSSSSEFVITGSSPEGFKKIRYRDASKPRDILLEQISETPSGYWDNENIIIPEEPILETLRKLTIPVESETKESLLTKPAE